ncbi:MAG: GNAT family N-acetyltransferase [Myxococcota bacterium]
MSFRVRPATLDDVEGIVHLNQLCYPDPEEGDVVWRRRHVESHLRIFGEGQWVAESDRGDIVGAATAIVVSLGRDPHRDHTWAGITDDGMLYSHDPFGDTLYGVDTTVHPEHRGQGVAKQLYAARRTLCQRRNLRRIVLGGRIPGYLRRADTMTAEEYARQVEAGAFADPVLTLQLEQGFALRKVMAHYIRDPSSRDHGTFLEWLNPEYRARPSRARSVRVSCVQYEMRKIVSFDQFAQQVSYFAQLAAGYGADFVVFPELLTAQLMSYLDVKTSVEAIRKLTEHTAEVDALFRRLAADLQTCILGGTHPILVEERILNVASLYTPEGELFRQAKLHITPNERTAWGVEPGSQLRVFDTPKARVGILICYDVEFPETARYLTDQGADLILNPFCTDDRQAYLRVRYCAQARAVENQVYVASAGTVGNLPDAENMDLQYAQSAVFSPSDFNFARDGILVEASPNAETVITTDVDLDALEAAIHGGSVRQRADRRPDLFRFDVDLAEGDDVPF